MLRVPRVRRDAVGLRIVVSLFLHICMIIFDVAGLTKAAKHLRHPSNEETFGPLSISEGKIDG